MTPRAPGAEGGIAVREREWTDQFGTHYEVRAQGRSERIYSQAITRYPHWGWPAERGTMHDRVRAMAEVDTGSAARAGTTEGE